MNAIPKIITIVIAYLLGAVPFGLLFTRIFSGIDVRSVGSGNIGATNVLRAAGKKRRSSRCSRMRLKDSCPSWQSGRFSRMTQ